MRNYLIILLVVIVSGSFALAATAATLSLTTEYQTVGVGDSVVVNVELASPEEKVNAFSGQINFNSNFFSVTAIRDGEGVVPLWVERPVVKDQSVYFAGGIPGGLQGGDRSLFSLVLTAKQAGRALLSITEAEVYKNDGLGSRAELTIKPVTITVTNASQKITAPALVDEIAPEDFTATINLDQNFFDGQAFVTFLAQDKLSGIERYEYATSTGRRIGADAVWRTTSSPLLLGVTNPRYFVYIKAIDRAGNSLIVRAPANLPLWWYEKILVWIILIAVCVLFGWRRLVKK